MTLASRRSALRLATIGLASVLAAPAIAADSMPFLTIAYFNGTCPQGWTPVAAAKGRFVVPAPEGGGSGAFAGAALDGTGTPMHEHRKATGSIHLAAKEFIAVDGCCNDSLGHSGTYTTSGSADDAASALPYIQFMACLKTDQATQGTVPTDVMVFNMTPQCADGWQEEFGAKGRYIVGLPDNGVPYATFGGPSLKPGELRTHTHGTPGSISFNGHAIAAGSGCCAHDYAASGSASFSGATQPAPTPQAPEDSAVRAPYYTASLCRKS